MLKKLFTVRNLAILLGVVALFVISGLLGLKVPAPVVSLAAEPVLHVGSFTITNSLLTAWVVMILLIVLSYFATRRIPSNLSAASTRELVPSGAQNFMELLVEGVYNLVRGVAGHNTAKFFPIVMTIFVFVLFSNLSGLLPGVGSIGWLEHPHDPATTGYVANGAILTGQLATPGAEGEEQPAIEPETAEAGAAGEEEAHGEGWIVVPFFRAPSADLNFTLALALATVILTQYFGIRTLKGNYFKKFVDFSGFKQGALMGVIGVFVGVLELIGELSRILSFSFRLFGNIFAGEVLLLVMGFLIPYIASLPFYGLEIFVGFIQAAVFMMLAVVFMSMATVGHGGAEHH